jgi:hypothetical protein
VAAAAAAHFVPVTLKTWYCGCNYLFDKKKGKNFSLFFFSSAKKSCFITRAPSHGYATKEGCRTERKSRNLEYAMGVRLTGFTT